MSFGSVFDASSFFPSVFFSQFEVRLSSRSANFSELTRFERGKKKAKTGPSDRKDRNRVENKPGGAGVSRSRLWAGLTGHEGKIKGGSENETTPYLSTTMFLGDGAGYCASSFNSDGIGGARGGLGRR